MRRYEIHKYKEEVQYFKIVTEMWNCYIVERAMSSEAN